MAKQDFYELLGVPREANADAIKKAFRKLAMKCHPDRNPGDKAAEQKFKDINEAYDVLKDEQKRAAYDRFGHAAFENGGRGAAGADFGFATGFADIFDEMFGEFMGSAAASRARPAATISATTSRSPSRMPSRASRRRCACRRWWRANPAAAAAPRPAPSR